MHLECFVFFKVLIHLDALDLDLLRLFSYWNYFAKDAF